MAVRERTLSSHLPPLIPPPPRVPAPAQGDDVWHERWGEDYNGQGGCVKYTDKWAERLLEGGGTEQWGDKWTESFKAGQGAKHGEVWSVGSDGGRWVAGGRGARGSSGHVHATCVGRENALVSVKWLQSHPPLSRGGMRG